MKLCEIIEKLDALYPKSLSAQWDNDGEMLVLDRNADVTGVVTTLDVTDSAIDCAISHGANLIISHHPFIFHPLKRIDDSVISKRIEKLILSGISVLSYHTRFDSVEGGMNDLLAEKLSLENPRPFGLDGEIPMGRIGTVPECSPAEFATLVADTLSTDVILYEGERPIRTVAILGGGGKDFIHTAQTLGADAMVTGDISYSVVCDELPLGITMIDAGHYATEIIATDAFHKVLLENFGIVSTKHYAKDPKKFILRQEEL